MFNKTLILGLSMALTASPAIGSAQDELDDQNSEAVVSPVAKKPEPKKITDRDHPDFVRCRSEPIIGSLSRKKRTCMTNAEWKETHRKGNKSSRDFVDDNQPGFMPGV